MEELGPDQRMQQLLQQSQLGNSSATCPSKKTATLICVNPACKKPSLHCEDCQACDFHLENHCTTVRIRYLTMNLKKQGEQKKKLVMKIMDIQAKMMEKLHQNKKKLLGLDGFSYFEKKQLEVLRSIYGDQLKKVDIVGKDAAQIIKKLQSANQELNNREETTFNKFKSGVQELTQNLIRLENDIIDKCYKYCLQDSKIVLKRSEDINFIINSLKSPLKQTKLQLLFRASEHDFRVSQFHKKCDNIQNTFVLILTEFDKVIAGYTPLKWESNPQGKFKEDHSGRSFLLSINAQKIMTLTHKKQAIYCHSDFGPTFGAGCDIYIGDQCNQNNKSYSEFLCSYDCDVQYERSQQIYQLFIGGNAPSYKVIEYEVFRVVQF